MIKNKEILNLDKNFVTFSLYIGINNIGIIGKKYLPCTPPIV